MNGSRHATSKQSAIDLCHWITLTFHKQRSREVHTSLRERWSCFYSNIWQTCRWRHTERFSLHLLAHDATIKNIISLLASPLAARTLDLSSASVLLTPIWRTRAWHSWISKRVSGCSLGKIIGFLVSEPNSEYPRRPLHLTIPSWSFWRPNFLTSWWWLSLYFNFRCATFTHLLSEATISSKIDLLFLLSFLSLWKMLEQKRSTKSVTL